MKKILAIVAMLALTLSMAFATEIICDKDAADGGIVKVDLTGAEKLIVKIDMTDTYGGGTIGFNSVDNNNEWDNKYQFTNEKPETLDITVDVAKEVAAAEDGSRSCEIQTWWHNADAPFKINYEVVMAAGDGAEEGGKTETTPSETGDVMNIALLSVVAVLAFAGVVVSSKKRA